MSDPVQVAIKNLQAYLKAQIPALTVLSEFPGANQKLVYPSVTIFSGQPTFMNLQPYSIAQTAPDMNNQVTTTWIVGEYDTHLQLDLWCRNKVERDQYASLLFAAINKKVDPMGLSLQLADYFNEWARYDFDGRQFVDDEAAIQRQEYRSKIDLLLNVKAVMQTTDYAMVILQNTPTVLPPDAAIS